jgi:hypothetical protein
MSHYILHLSDGRTADVRQGTIRRKRLSLWPLSAVSEKKRGYVIHIGAQVYLMLRSMNGVWLTEALGNFTPTPDDAVGLELKRLIENHA